MDTNDSGGRATTDCADRQGALDGFTHELLEHARDIGSGDGKPGRCFVSVAGPQSSRGIGEIEGKAARGSSEREREPSEFQSPRRFR